MCATLNPEYEPTTLNTTAITSAHSVAGPTDLDKLVMFEHSDKESHTRGSTGVELNDWGLGKAPKGVT